MRDCVKQLARTLAQTNRYLSSQLEREGLATIAPSHGDIFAQLFNHESLPMADLAQRICRDPSTVTALVKKLASDGYVKTFKQPGDKRVTRVALTEKGIQLEPAFKRISHSLIDVFCQNLTEQDILDLDDMLRTIQKNFQSALKGDSYE